MGPSPNLFQHDKESSQRELHEYKLWRFWAQELDSAPQPQPHWSPSGWIGMPTACQALADLTHDLSAKWTQISTANWTKSGMGYVKKKNKNKHLLFIRSVSISWDLKACLISSSSFFSQCQRGACQRSVGFRKCWNVTGLLFHGCCERVRPLQERPLLPPAFCSQCSHFLSLPKEYSKLHLISLWSIYSSSFHSSHERIGLRLIYTLQ